MDRDYAALVVDDDTGIRQSIRLCLEADGARVVGVGTARAALELLERSVFDVIFLDVWLGRESGLTVLPDIVRRQPTAGIVMITAYASFESAVDAMKRGAADYLPKPFTPEQVRSAARRVLVSATRAPHDDPAGDHLFESHSAGYRLFLDAVGRAAATDSVVLLGGESGTGKTMLARWMHGKSPRAGRPFVTVHCPALAGDLMTSSLFGHRKGAYTGAVSDAAGKVDEAEGGTLFLDEVGDLTPDAQARLLRFLNDQTYERLGEVRERRADVRVIAASNRELDDDVARGRFREDLMYRLNVVNLVVPPLRDRREDVLPLALHFLRSIAVARGRPGMTLSDDAEAAIAGHPWPGNIRQLRNAIERAVVFAPATVIDVRDLGLPQAGPAAAAGRSPSVGDDVSLEQLEREHIARVIAHAPTLDAAARILGIDPTTLQRKRKRYGLA